MTDEDRVADLEARLEALEQKTEASVARARNVWGFKNPLLQPPAGDTRRDRSIWIPASEFVSSTGAPALNAGFSSNYMGWNLDDTATEAILAQVPVPLDFLYNKGNAIHTRNRQGIFNITVGDIEMGLYFVVPTTNTGTIIFSIQARLTNDNNQTYTGSTNNMNDAMTYGSSTYSSSIAVNSQHILQRLALSIGSGFQAPRPHSYGDHPGIGPELLTIKISRLGGNVSDTLTGDVVIIGGLVYYVAQY